MTLSNGDLPVTPLVMESGHPYHASQVCFENAPLTSGLTKREHFAGLAMQNMLNSFNPFEQGDFDSSDFELTAKLSVGMADALLKELSK